MIERSDREKQLATAQARTEQLAKELDASASRLEQYEQELKDQGLIVQQTNAGTLARKYNLAWYVAAGAIGGCALLSLGLIWSLARVVPPPEVDEADGSPPPTTPAHPRQEPPHRIS